MYNVHSVYHVLDNSLRVLAQGLSGLHCPSLLPPCQNSELQLTIASTLPSKSGWPGL